MRRFIWNSAIGDSSKVSLNLGDSSEVQLKCLKFWRNIQCFAHVSVISHRNTKFSGSSKKFGECDLAQFFWKYQLPELPIFLSVSVCYMEVYTKGFESSRTAFFMFSLFVELRYAKQNYMKRNYTRIGLSPRGLLL